MKIELAGRVAIVTGAATGIGRAIALQLGRCGAAVVVNYCHSEQEAYNVVQTLYKIGARAEAMRADVTQKKEVDRLVQATLERFGGRIDILVNNAGSLVERCLIADMREELWDEVIALNLKSVFLCSQAVLPTMKKQGWGRIVNIASIAGRNGGGLGATHYSAAKAGVIAFTKGLAKELARTGITVNAVNPGVITTPYHDKFTAPEVRQRFLELIPLGREGTPDEVAAAVVFLASEHASYITGETIEVNGGMLMD
ncbi:MAG: 3-oxoacyl-ACP reductase FabG [candidate division KSB1 bacterium]|nr:3-oxoacyl-ACP reductase FabG [candidate division KSB1 bacterium]